MAVSEQNVDVAVRLMGVLVRLYRALGMNKAEGWEEFMSQAPGEYTDKTLELARTTYDTVWELNNG